MLRVVQGCGDARVETTADRCRQCPDCQISARLVVRCTGTETRLIVTCCHQFVVAFVVIDPVILVKFTFHFLSVVLSAQLNLETGMSFSSIWLNTFVKFSRMDLETPAWNKRKSEVVASQGQGRRAARQAVGRGRQRSRCSLATGPGAGHSVVSQRGRAEGIDRHRLSKLILSLARSPWQRQWQRQVGFITKQRAP